MRILVSGSHGLIGSALVASLRGHGHEVVRLVREPAGPGDLRWDPAAGELDLTSLDDIDAAVNLAGAGIADKRWTDDQKRRIRASRVDATGLAVGVYGDGGYQVLDEDNPAGSGFLAEVCRQWEAATAPAGDAGVRVVHIRTGIVLSAAAGALKKQLPLFKVGLGGKLGSGRQYQSWITLDDEVGAIEHCLEIAEPRSDIADGSFDESLFAADLGSVANGIWPSDYLDPRSKSG